MQIFFFSNKYIKWVEVENNNNIENMHVLINFDLKN